MKKKYIFLIALFVLAAAVWFSLENTAEAPGHTTGAEEEETIDFDSKGCEQVCLVIRSDVGKALELRNCELNSWDDIEGVLKMIKEAYPDYIPVMAGYDKAVIEYAADVDKGILFDTLSGDIGVLENPAESLEVTDFYETDSFKTMCSYMYKWRIAGLIGKNEMISTTGLVKEEYSAGFFAPNYVGINADATACCGINMSVYPLFTDIVNSASVEFEFDNTDVITEEAACEEVIDIYKNALLSGEINPSSGLERFIDALKNAGIDKVLKAKQKQLRRSSRNVQN